MADIRKLVGVRLRELRRAHGWTQEELGERASLSYKFIGEVERGVANPTIDSVGRLAEALGVDAADLVSTERQHPVVQRLSLDDYAAVRDARDSLETLLKRVRPRSPSGRR